MRDSEITLIEAAAILGTSYNRTMRWVLVGTLKGERRAGRWFVDAADLERFQAERSGHSGMSESQPPTRQRQ